MSFNNLSEFLQMGGHGLYVWLCYGAGLIIFILNAWLPRLGKKRLLRELLQKQRRQQSRETASSVASEK